VSTQNASLSNPAAGWRPGIVPLRSLQATSVPDAPNTAVEHRCAATASIAAFIDVSYVGSRGDNLIQPLDINQPQPADVVGVNGNQNLVRPYKGYTTITMRQTTAYSRYSGFLTQFRHEAGGPGP
jgi:hypothetical protein